MKQLKEFENWTDSIIKSTVFEKKDTRDERAIERQRDIVYKAKQAFPEYPESQAIELFLADKLSDIEQRDFEQNKVINLQRRENDKLKGNLQDLQSEIQNIEAGGQETDREIARLKQLSGKLQTDVEQRRVGGREVNELLAQVEQLKNKPGVTPEQYKDIKDKVEDFSKQKVNPEEFKKFENQLKTLAASEAIDKEQISNLQSAIDSVTRRQEKIGDISDVAGKLRDLESKQSEIEQVATANKELVGDLNQRLETLGAADRADIERASELLRDLQGTKQELDAKQQELSDFERNLQTRVDKEIEQEKATTKKRMQDYFRRAKKRSAQAATKINALVGKDAGIEKIRELGRTITDLQNKDFEDMTIYPSIDDISLELSGLEGWQELTERRRKRIEAEIKKLKSTVDFLLKRLVQPDLPNIPSPDLTSELELSPEQKKEKDYQEYVQQAKDIMKKNNLELDLKEDASQYVNIEPEYSKIIEYLKDKWLKSSDGYRETALLANKFLDLSYLDRIIYYYLKKSKIDITSINNADLEKEFTEIYLPLIIKKTNQKANQKANQKKDYLNQPTNPIDKGLSELEESLDRIIGKDVATWIKR
jgi:chromosome segregation ATPase